MSGVTKNKYKNALSEQAVTMHIFEQGIPKIKV